MLSDKNRLKRIHWAKKHARKHWRNAILCDEALFSLHGGRGKNRWQSVPKLSHKVHIWAGFSSMGTFPLCIIRENLNGLLYCKILEWHLLSQAEVFHGNSFFLVKDNDPKDTSKVLKRDL